MSTVLDSESARIALQEQLDLLKTADERNRWGQFATPPALARNITEYAWQRLKSAEQEVRFVDPAVGTGSFFSSLLQTVPRERISCATGIELDRGFADAAQKLWSEDGLRVTQGDFTRLTPPTPGFNLVLTNPPYVRHHHLTTDEKDRLRARVTAELGIPISGLAGLYCYFLLLADAWLAPGGLSIWLIPSEFMDVNYGTALKKYLTERVSLVQLHRFRSEDVQFSDALVSSVIVVFEKCPPNKAQNVVMSLGGPITNPDQSELVSLGSLCDSRKWTQTSEVRSGKAPTNEATLGDLFTIKRGLATGDNSFFIVPRTVANLWNVPQDFFKPILPSPRYLKESVVEADDSGYPRLETQLALVDCALSEDELRHNHEGFWKYLAEGRSRGIDKGFLTSRRTPWYSQEKRPPAPFLCTYMGRSRGDKKPFRFIWNKSQAVAANVYLMLYPKSELKAALAQSPELHAIVFAALQGIETAEFVREGRVYGGGLYKMEPAELARLSGEEIAGAIEMRQQRQFQF